MPGRRLILIMVLLLLSLSVLSATRDVSRSRLPGSGSTTTGSTTTGTTTQAGPETTPAPPGEDEPTARQERDTAVSRASLPSPDPVEARLGERVILSIRSEAPEILAVRELGVQAPVGPGTGGVLDLVAGQPGRYPITLALSGRRVGELRVRG